MITFLTIILITCFIEIGLSFFSFLVIEIIGSTKSADML